jgi:alkanesulfonate monooxygenase SsuD/methylene tetrahydromethanopterin reductase-like flavin-dependent oxidoreductase (luciferase family)
VGFQNSATSVKEETSRFLGGDLIIRHEPVGVVGGIVPWNYPQTLSSFKYAPALAAGCTIVLKPSPETAETDLEPERFYPETAIIGGPETVAERIRQQRDEHGVRCVNLLASFFGSLPEHMLRRSLQLFAGEVIPQLARAQPSPVNSPATSAQR